MVNEYYATVLRVLLLFLKEFRKISNTAHLAGLSISMLLPSFDLMKSPSRLQVTDPWQQEDKEELSHKQCNLHAFITISMSSSMFVKLCWSVKELNIPELRHTPNQKKVCRYLSDLCFLFFYEVNGVKGYVWFPICLVKQIERNVVQSVSNEWLNLNFVNKSKGWSYTTWIIVLFDIHLASHRILLKEMGVELC